MEFEGLDNSALLISSLVTVILAILLPWTLALCWCLISQRSSWMHLIESPLCDRHNVSPISQAINFSIYPCPLQRLRECEEGGGHRCYMCTHLCVCAVVTLLGVRRRWGSWWGWSGAYCMAVCPSRVRDVGAAPMILICFTHLYSEFRFLFLSLS